MKHVRYGGLALILLVGIGCQPKPTEDGSRKLDGQWRPVELHDNGQEITGPRLKRITFGFNESQFMRGETNENPNSLAFSASGLFSIRVDMTQTPHLIDFVSASGKDLGKMQQGIFELVEGQKLKLCFGKLDADRPTEFAPGPNVTYAVLEYKGPPPKPGPGPMPTNLTATTPATEAKP